MEAKGALGSYFDAAFSDPYFGQKSWEQAEIAMNESNINGLFGKVNISADEVDVAFGGDLVNQLVASNYAMRSFDIPFFGVYSACASAVEASILASIFLEGKFAKRALAFASSHTNMAEKQFRMPVEYGGAKGDTAQYTATGAGAALFSVKNSKIKVESATLGCVVDAMQNDPANMGAAMAPAAANTILRHFGDLGIDASYYDLILTGDLSNVGCPILLDLLKQAGHDITSIHDDCGKLLYNDDQPTFSGASGAGCVSIVMFSYVTKLLKQGKIKNALIVGTGALLNALIVSQKETIPCVAHAIALSNVN